MRWLSGLNLKSSRSYRIPVALECHVRDAIVDGLDVIFGGIGGRRIGDVLEDLVHFRLQVVLGLTWIPWS